MTRALHVAPNLSFPAQAVTETFGILAVRGAGKSNTAAVMAEEMFAAKLPFVVVDPAKAWWGLRSSRDGRGPGLPIPIFGGAHGDVPLERGAGTMMADLIVDQRLSCVLDLDRLDSEASKKQFLLDFARRLYQRNEQPLHLFLEEADDYIPQRPMRDEAQLLRAWENIVRRGRNRGLGITLITQRSAAINKNVLTQVQTLIAMRTTGPQDIAAIREWVKYHQVGEELIASLAGLDDGEAWVWSPRLLGKTVRVRFRLRETFDSGATPAMGAAAKAPATLADIDLAAVKVRMAATIEKAKAEDPRELRRRIATLEAELKQRVKGTLVKAEPAPKRVNVPVLKAGEIKRLERLWRGLERVHDRLQHVASAARDVGTKALSEAHHLAEALRTVTEAGREAGLVALPSGVKSPSPAKPEPGQIIAVGFALPTDAIGAHLYRTDPPRANAGAPRIEGDTLPKAQRAILTAIVQRAANGRPSTAIQVSLLSGYSKSSSSFHNALGALRTAGLIAGPGHDLRPTAEGIAAVGDIDQLPTGPELRAVWLGHQAMGKAERALLTALLQHQAGLDRDRLSDLSGYSATSSSFHNALGRLRSLELVHSVGVGVNAAHADFFA